MKKLILSLAAVVMVLSACTKNEVAQTPDVPITFTSPVVNAVTKALVTGPIDGTVYPANETFGVFALYTTSNFTTWNVDNTTDGATSNLLYINGDECYNNKYSSSTDAPNDGKSGVWTTNPPYYWPKNGAYLTFAAFSPYAISSVVTYGSTGLSISSYDVTFNYDVLYSDRTYNKQGNSGGNTYPGSDSPVTDGSKAAVDINFKHALSLIKFKVKASESYGDKITIVLKEIRISDNIAYKGAFSQNITENATNPALSTENPTWTPTNDVKGYTITGPTAALTTDYVNCGSDIIVLPQVISQNAKLTIKYTVTDSRNNIPVVTEKPVDFHTLLKNLDSKIDIWEPGKRYVYNISIGLEQIVFSPEMTDWVKCETTDITL